MATVPFVTADMFVGFDVAPLHGAKVPAKIENIPTLSNFLTLVNFLLFLPKTVGKVLIANYGPVDSILVVEQMFPSLTFYLVDPGFSANQQVRNINIIRATTADIPKTILNTTDPLLACILFPYENVPCANQENLTKWYFDHVRVWTGVENFLLPLTAFTGCPISEISLPEGHVFRRPFSNQEHGMVWVTPAQRTPKVWDLSWYRRALQLSAKNYLLPEISDLSYPGLGTDYNSMAFIWTLVNYLKKTRTPVTNALVNQFVSFVVDVIFHKPLADVRK